MDAERGSLLALWMAVELVFIEGVETSYLPQQQTGSEILGRNIGNKDFSRSGITGFSFGDLFNRVPITSQGYGEFDPMKKSRERQGIEEVAYDEFDFVEPMYVDGKINPRYVEENPSNKKKRICFDRSRKY